MLKLKVELHSRKGECSSPGLQTITIYTCGCIGVNHASVLLMHSHTHRDVQDVWFDLFLYHSSRTFYIPLYKVHATQTKMRIFESAKQLLHILSLCLYCLGHSACCVSSKDLRTQGSIVVVVLSWNFPTSSCGYC